jgi:integrase
LATATPPRRFFNSLAGARASGFDFLATLGSKPFVNKRFAGGKYIACDAFATWLRRVIARLGIKKPIKGLRKTAATLLESHPVYGRYAQYFLGHAPASVADKHYVKPDQTLFDRAVSWVGEQLGLRSDRRKCNQPSGIHRGLV